MGTWQRAFALLVVFGLAGCSAPATRYSAGYAHHHGYETARSVASPRTSTGDVGTTTRGIASFYSGHSATGERVGSNLTAAHPSLPFGTNVRVTNLKNGQSVTVRINDRGPFVHNRSIDLSDAAAGAIGMKGAGVAPVKMEVVQGPGR